MTEPGIFCLIVKATTCLIGQEPGKLYSCRHIRELSTNRLKRCDLPTELFGLTATGGRGYRLVPGPGGRRIARRLAGSARPGLCSDGLSRLETSPADTSLSSMAAGIDHYGIYRASSIIGIVGIGHDRSVTRYVQLLAAESLQRPVMAVDVRGIAGRAPPFPCDMIPAATKCSAVRP